MVQIGHVLDIGVEADRHSELVLAAKELKMLAHLGGIGVHHLRTVMAYRSFGQTWITIGG